MKYFRFFLTCLLILIAATTAQTKETNLGAATALKKIYPNFAFHEVNPSPVPDLFEVISAENIVYFAPETGHLIFGEIWSRDGKNITAESLEKCAAKSIATLPLDKAVKIGNGKNTVIEFTDPDCPFCRKGSTFFKDRTDVSRYVFFLPLTNLHPEATPKAAFILSAPNQAQAYEEVMAGVYDDRPLPSFFDNGLLAEHLKVATQLKITGTPKYWINGTAVAGADVEKIKTLLQSSQQEETTKIQERRTP